MRRFIIVTTPHRLGWARIVLTGLTAIVAFVVGSGVTNSAERLADNGHALSVIFGDEHLADGVPHICLKAATLPPEQRFEFLADAVLPTDPRPAIRLHVDFTQTNPAPMPADPDSASGFRVATGGGIVSPALDLIDTAGSLGRLDELRQRVEVTTTTTVRSRIDRLAMLGLIDSAREDLPSAQAEFDEVFALVLSETNVVESPVDAALLCVHVAAHDPDLSRAIVDAAYLIVTAYQRGVERNAWQQQFAAAYARVKHTTGLEADAPAAESTATTLSRWMPASLPRAQYRGAGFPVAEWTMASGRADNLSSHDEDFLYFAVPLRGNFEVECDVTGFGWRESQLLFAGKWVGLVYNHESYEVGDIGGSVTRIQFAPPLTKVDDYIHYRTVVRDGAATTYFNGRQIHRQPLSAEHDPWLAVRSTARSDGGVRNVRLSGDAVVPDELTLTDGPDLAGWIPYFEDVVGIDWRHRAGPDNAGEIHARRQWELPRGCHKESLLFYHRPMLEDGSIEYEFWYDAGAHAAHAALDRLCFLLRSDGVRVHWLTDGPFDRTELPPDNLFDEPDNRRGPARLPLHDGDWNRLRLTVRGDTVALLLNGELVYQRRLESTNQRTFGLFHYADQTELRVRNVTWTGDWPREIPEVNEQELAIDETDSLDDRLGNLPAVFSHDFARQGLPLDRFAVIQGNPEHFDPGPEGLLAWRQAEGGYRNATVSPSLRVGGDFDIRASFDQLGTNPQGTGSSNIFLMILTDNGTADESLLSRRQNLALGRDQEIIQCVRVSETDGEDRRRYFNHQPVEADTGTLRLARQGERIYYLFAEHDSQQFRLIGEEAFPTDDLRIDGIRLISQIYGDDGSTNVTWKKLTIRAESLSGPAVIPGDDLLVELNRERAVLAEHYIHDFTSTPPDDAAIYRGDRREWNPDDDGLLIVATGTDNWTSTGASLRRQVEGDFDIAIRFDPRRFDTPAEGQNSSVYLQVGLADVGASRLGLILVKSPDDTMDVIVQLSVANEQSIRSYRQLGAVGLTSIQGLRLARRGREIAGIVISEELGGERIVAQADVGDASVVANGTEFLVHTGGADRESHIVWKSLDVHAEHILE